MIPINTKGRLLIATLGGAAYWLLAACLMLWLCISQARAFGCEDVCRMSPAERTETAKKLGLTLEQKAAIRKACLPVCNRRK